MISLSRMGNILLLFKSWAGQNMLKRQCESTLRKKNVVRSLKQKMWVKIKMSLAGGFWTRSDIYILQSLLEIFYDFSNIIFD